MTLNSTGFMLGPNMSVAGQRESFNTNCIGGSDHDLDQGDDNSGEGDPAL
jgi:hypothetical protein